MCRISFNLLSSFFWSFSWPHIKSAIWSCTLTSILHHILIPPPRMLCHNRIKKTTSIWLYPNSYGGGGRASSSNALFRCSIWFSITTRSGSVLPPEKKNILALPRLDPKTFRIQSGDFTHFNTQPQTKYFNRIIWHKVKL